MHDGTDTPEKALVATPTSVYALPVKATTLDNLEILNSAVPHFPYAVRGAALLSFRVCAEVTKITQAAKLAPMK